MRVASVYEQAAAFRAALLKGEQAQAEATLHAYGRTFGDVSAKVRALLAAVQEAGGTATAAQLTRLTQWSTLLQTLADANAALVREVGGIVGRSQLAALLQASNDSQQLIAALVTASGGFVPFVQPAPLDALHALVGMTEGGPVSDLLRAAGDTVAERVKRELTTGLAAGRDQRKLAKDIQALWGQGLTRSLALVRTETMRAYREGSRAAYQENSDVISGYRWLSAHSARTCPACLALDGREFPLDKPMPAHVNCRCTMIPILRNRDTPSRADSGQSWFDKQPTAVKLQIVGPRGLAAIEGGASLADFVHWRHDSDWGKQSLWAVPN